MKLLLSLPPAKKDRSVTHSSILTGASTKPYSHIFAENPMIVLFQNILSPEWEEYVKKQPVKFILRREVMAPFCSVSSKNLRPLPEGYSISPFTRKIFEEHPFDQGRSYPDFEDFQRSGAGSAVLFDGKVVSASSSFLSFEGHVELDVYTDIEHRKKGLADHCVFEMLRECSEKKYTVHWDAQNPMSSGMAVSHGFTPVTDYAVYWLEK